MRFRLPLALIGACELIAIPIPLERPLIDEPLVPMFVSALIAASIVMLLAQLTMQNMSGYVYPEYYNNSRAQSVSTVLMTAGMLVAAALAKPLAARFGKAEVSAASGATDSMSML